MPGKNNGDCVAYKQLFYRPLLILIADLLMPPHFLTAVTYKRKIQNDNHDYSDLMDGDVPKKHLSEMNEKFLNWKSRNKK